MAILINSEQDMIAHINMAIAGARTRDCEMVVVPMVIADTPEKASALLLGVKDYDPRCAADNLPKDAVGKMRIASKRTVHDVLDEFESPLSMFDMRLLRMAGECLVDQHVKGQTRKLNLKVFGELIVDLQKFSQLTGLPMKSDECKMYSVFVREVTDKGQGGNKTLLVLVKGTVDVAGGDGGTPAALEPMMCRLEARALSGFETIASFHARELDNVWELYNNALFLDLLGWWRPGYSYTVISDENQGLKISY